ncbi:MAG: hypothetical protein IT323_19160, partial [Anaerolineae bacterium]|nr:hypothetical protein [Anaerolineae bacterium]
MTAQAAFPVRRARYGAWLAAACALVFAAFAVRVWNLDAQSLWHDEGWSVFAAYTPFGPMGIRGADVNAPFAYYASVGLGLRLMGDSVWAMRFCSVLYGVVTVALAGRIAGRWYGPSAGGLAMLLTAFSPILWVFSQEIRAYVAMPLAALALLGLADGLLARRGMPGRRELGQIWLPLFAVEMFALYAHNLSVPLVAWLNIAVAAALLVAREWRRLAVWLVTQAAALVLYLPWLLTQRQTGGALNTPPALDLGLLWSIWASYFTGVKALLTADAAFLALVAIFGALALVAGILAVWRFPNRRTWLVLSQVVLLPAFELAIILAARIDFHPRYFIVGVPATMILVAAGVLGRKWPLVPIMVVIVRLRALAAAGVAVLGIALFVSMASLLVGSPVYQHDDFRAIAERYAALGPNDAIVIPYGWEPSLDYYQEKLNIRARFIEVPVHSSPPVIATWLAEGLQGVQRAEVLTWYQLPADVRGAFPCLMGAVGRLDDSLTVSGLRTDRYTLQPGALAALIVPGALREASILPQTPIAVGDLRLANRALIGDGASGTTPCLVGQWRVDEQTPHDWKASVEVLRHGGWALPQDSNVLDDRQLPTSLWPAGHAGASFTPLADPPRPLDPSTAYLVLLKAYHPANG